MKHDESSMIVGAHNDHYGALLNASAIGPMLDPCHSMSPLSAATGLSYRLGSSAAGEFVFCLIRLPEQTAQAKLGTLRVFFHWAWRLGSLSAQGHNMY